MGAVLLAKGICRCLETSWLSLIRKEAHVASMLWLRPKIPLQCTHRSAPQHRIGPPQKSLLRNHAVTGSIGVLLMNSSPCLSFSRGCGKNQDESQ